jgi:hypothetical protein
MIVYVQNVQLSLIKIRKFFFLLKFFFLISFSFLFGYWYWVSIVMIPKQWKVGSIKIREKKKCTNNTLSSDLCHDSYIIVNLLSFILSSCYLVLIQHLCPRATAAPPSSNHSLVILNHFNDPLIMTEPSLIVIY